MNVDLTVNSRGWSVSLERTDRAGAFVVTANGRRRLIDAVWIDRDTLSLVDGETGEVAEAGLRRDGSELDVVVRGQIFRVASASRSNLQRRDAGTVSVEGRQAVVSSMPGRVTRVLVEVGERVTARQGVVIVEAMKMENELRAPKDGVVREIAVREGATIERGVVLMVIE